MEIQEFLDNYFPSHEWEVAPVAFHEILDEPFLSLIPELRDSDDVAAHLHARPDYFMMSSKGDPATTSFFFKFFVDEIKVDEIATGVYQRWYPKDFFYLVCLTNETAISLKSYLDGDNPRPLKDLIDR